jgi:hypothetical protein
MPRIVIELDTSQQRRLQAIASAERKSEADLCLEAVERFLQARERAVADTDSDAYEPLRKMIGLVKEGPTDASVHHDVRPGDER